ncbi:hypothetical protein D3C76_1158780 [compost metagenome]
MQLAGALGGFAHLGWAGATADQLVRVVAADQPPIGLFDLARLSVRLNAEHAQSVLITEVGAG